MQRDAVKHPKMSNGGVACLQLLWHPLDPSDVKAINQHQMKGKTPDPALIKDPKIRELTEKFNLMEEMFGNKASGLSFCYAMQHFISDLHACCTGL